jgi:hypothetical protein
LKKDFVIAVIAILAVTVVAFALDRVRDPNLPLTPSQPFVAKGEVAHAPAGGKVMMRVNGEPVTEAEFNAFAQSLPEEQRGMLTGSPQGMRLIANEIAKLKVLEQEAQRLGVANDPEVRTQLTMTHSQILAMRALQKIVEPRVEQIVREEYEKEKKDTIELKHIAIAYAGGQYPSRDGSARQVPQALEKAKAIAARLHSGGNFAEIARAESDDPNTAQNGGSLGPARREMLPPEIAGVLTTLQPGQISDPVRTPLGVHIFRYDPVSLDAMRPQLQQRARQQAMQEAVAKLEKQAKIDLEPRFFPPQPAAPRGTLPATQ